MNILIVALLLLGQKFQADDPIRRDNDRAMDAANVTKYKLNDYYDFIQHSFGKPGDRSKSPAANINTLGEVPDSSWFENRHGLSRMTIDALVRGPNTGDGPSMEKPWTVIDAKTEGVTPGFRIRDARGDVYFVKFDPVTNPEMATAAEVISTKFFYAMGYNVPENYLVFFTREQVTGRTDLDAILKRVHRNNDGTYRAIASKMLPGTPAGPFQYWGTRPDDPNDIFPHENRRELRGLRVISSWLNHDDSRAINSLDMVLGEKGSRYVKHYLIDFGSTLGSASIFAQKPRAGWEYMWQPSSVLKRVATLGLWDSTWIRVQYPDYPSIGRIESAHFKPEEWKPEYPNPAFLNATDEDSYWAAKIVMSFTDEEIASIVKTGRLSDSEAEAYLIRTLIERRDKIGRYWLTRLPSFDRFEITSDGELKFEHLASYYDFARLPEHQVRWKAFEHGIDVAQITSKEGIVEVYVRKLLSSVEEGSSLIIGIDRQSKTTGAQRND